MDKIGFKNVSLEYMLQHLVDEIIKGIQPINFYWYHEDTGLHEIVECDLYRGRFITDDGDFSEFEWEIKNSLIYVREKDYMASQNQMNHKQRWTNI